MRLECSGVLRLWKGPAAWHLVTVPETESAALASIAGVTSPGWGMIPVTVTIGETT